MDITPPTSVKEERERLHTQYETDDQPMDSLEVIAESDVDSDYDEAFLFLSVLALKGKGVVKLIITKDGVVIAVICEDDMENAAIRSKAGWFSLKGKRPRISHVVCG